MDELAAADVDAHVGGCRRGVVGVGEEHQVAGPQVAVGDGIAVVELLVRRAVDADPVQAADVLGEAGAVEAGGGGAAADVGAAHVFLRGGRQLLAQRGAAGGGAAGRGASAASAVGLAGAVVGVGDLGQGDQIAADIADDAVILDLVPAAVEAEDVNLLAAGCLGHHVAGGGGGAAQVGEVGIHRAVAQLHVLPLLHLDVLGAHVADVQVVVHQVPVALLADDDHIVAVGGGVDDLGVGGSGGAQPQAGRRRHDADAGLELRGVGKDRHGRQDDHQHGCQDDNSIYAFHMYPPSVLIYCSAHVPAIHSPHPAPCRSRLSRSF